MQPNNTHTHARAHVGRARGGWQAAAAAPAGAGGPHQQAGLRGRHRAAAVQAACQPQRRAHHGVAGLLPLPLWGARQGERGGPAWSR